MEVIIMRGLPGSGKSTWFKELKRVAAVTRSHAKIVSVSADDYHVNKLGVYEFDPKNAGEAHRRCLDRFHAILLHGIEYDTLVVDNTNTCAYEIAPYYALALMVKVSRVRIVRIHVPIEVCLLGDRNTHHVPDRTMWAMWRKLQNEVLPPYWQEDTIVGHMPPSYQATNPVAGAVQ